LIFEVVNFIIPLPNPEKSSVFELYDNAISTLIKVIKILEKIALNT
jgi:hypothetical protein